MTVYYSKMEFPSYEWTTSNPKIDLILPYPPNAEFSWNQREGWARALIELGCLNQLFWVWDNPLLLEQLFDSLRYSEADFILIMCGDHHQYWLHDSEKKREFWRALKKPSVCHSIERILNNPFKDSLGKTRSALRAFDAFIYIDELSETLFSKKPSLWIPQYVDETVFRSTIPFEKRINKVYFRGKTKNYGIAGVYKDRRELLTALLKDNDFELSDSSINPMTISEAAGQKGSYRFVLNAPANCTGYSASLYEAMACGCVVFNYELSPEEVKSKALFKEGVHFISYNKDSVLDLLNKAKGALANYVDYKIMSEEALTETLEKHTIKKRALEVIDFINSNWDRLKK
jgi:hypothetical protein